MSVSTQPLADWATHLQSRRLSPRTVDAYTSWVRRLSAWAGADPLTLTRTDLERWIAAHPHWSASTHQKACQATRYYYRWATDLGLIAADPAATLRPARVPRPVSHPCPEHLYRAALDAASGQTYWRLRIAGDTGLRRSELAAVTSADVVRSLSGPVLRVLGKGGKERLVPLPPDVAAWLEMQRGPLFPARAGGTLTPAGVGRWYTRHVGVHPHALRHRYATRAYRASRDILAVQQLLGHANVTTTQMYVAAGEDEARAAAAGAWSAA